MIGTVGLRTCGVGLSLRMEKNEAVPRAPRIDYADAGFQSAVS